MTSHEFSFFLNNISAEPLLVLDANIHSHNYIPLNLSASNKALKDVDVSTSSSLGDYINDYIHSRGAKVAFGGYNETRNIYQRSAYFNQTDAVMVRNIHLGVDLWLEAGSKIFAPLDGKVHSFGNNRNFGDYGPTIILKHLVDEVEFFSLYGHLSMKSIIDLQIGQLFQQGQQFSSLGDASVNGDYPPHLHFQIIRDLQGFEGDYPGVSSQQNLEFYLSNCPDPNLLLKLS